MCGRFSLTTEFEHIQAEFLFEMAADTFQYEPRYNIAPSQPVLAVIDKKGKRVGGYLRWGLVPSWAKDEKIGYKMINARSETIDEKPSFKQALKSRRCLIVADSFYEWKTEGKIKRPFRFMMKNEKPFAFAGLWEKWEKGEKPLFTCTIITTTPNDLTKEVHDRMPVILNEEKQNIWLNATVQDTSELTSILTPYSKTEMAAYEISSLVNSPKNESKEIIAPLNSL